LIFTFDLKQSDFFSFLVRSENERSGIGIRKTVCPSFCLFVLSVCLFVCSLCIFVRWFSLQKRVHVCCRFNRKMVQAVTCNFKAVTCNFKVVSCNFKVLTCNFKVVTCNFKVVTCNFKVVTCNFKFQT
jgi:hypothetical protein